jgi:hypothetical protein
MTHAQPHNIKAGRGMILLWKQWNAEKLCNYVWNTHRNESHFWHSSVRTVGQLSELPSISKDVVPNTTNGFITHRDAKCGCFCMLHYCEVLSLKLQPKFKTF